MNDAHGDLFGDKVLKEVAERMQLELRNSDTIARLGRDEFVILLPGVDSEALVPIVNKIIHVMDEPVVADDISLSVGSSLGIAFRLR